MKAELKKEWVNALRSGKYEQGRGCMYRDGKYCCLGVLAEVIGLEFSRSTSHASVLLPSGYAAMPPPEILKSIDLAFFHAQDLSVMNDRGETFLDISNYIENHIPGEILA